jgi:hypothetical protein
MLAVDDHADDHADGRDGAGRRRAGSRVAHWRRLDAESAGPAGMDAAVLGSVRLGAREFQRQDPNGAACHARMCITGTILRPGSEEPKRRWPPAIAAGGHRLRSFAVFDPTRRGRPGRAARA